MKNLTQFIYVNLLILIVPVFIHAQVLHTELLGRPTDQGVSIQMIFADSVNIYAKYGTISGNYTDSTSQISIPKGQTTEINLVGLKPSTKYYYRIVYVTLTDQKKYIRPEYTFNTARQSGDTFVFTVQADPHLDASSDTALYRQCLMNQLKDHPDFMIDLGDFLMTDKLQNKQKVVPHDTITYRCQLLRSKYEVVGHSLPLFIALGNHEAEAGWYNNGTANNIAVWDAQERLKYFPNPFPNAFYTGDTNNVPYVGKRGNYYAWTWGDALFIVLDPYWYTKPKPDSLHGWYWTLGKAQYDWLKQTLEQSTSKFKYIFSHQIVGGDPQGRGGTEYADFYEWGGKNIDSTDGFKANRPGWYKPIKDLLTEHRTNIFFHGHDHFFGKQDKECLIYQETPQPSLPNFNYPSQAASYGYLQGLIISNSGHLRVTVSPEGTRVEYIKAYLPAQENANRHNGDVVASYFIGAKNCYDSLRNGIPLLWNTEYLKEVIFPNPFHDQTRISFELSTPQYIQAEIIDLKGQIIGMPLKGQMIPAGTYTFVWDGEDIHGQRVPSGTYIYRISYGQNQLSTGRLIIQ